MTFFKASPLLYGGIVAVLFTSCSPALVEEISMGITEGIIEEIDIHNQKADKDSKPAHKGSQNGK